MKTILAPVDFSAASDAVVAQAAALARAFAGRIVFLSVVQPPVIISDYGPWMENIVDIVAAGERATAKRLERLRERFAGEPVEIETELATGAPIPAIVEAAKKFSADFIVMGSHGHTALYDLVVGSTTHGVLKRATCPVVIVPAPPVARPKTRPTARR